MDIIIIAFVLCLPILAAINYHSKCNKLKSEYDNQLLQLVTENEKLNKELCNAKEAYKKMQDEVEYMKLNSYIDIKHVPINETRRCTSVKLTIDKIQENSDIFISWDNIGSKYSLIVKDTNFNNENYIIRCNYVNKGWKRPELVNEHEQCCVIKIDDAFVTIYSPHSGIITYFDKKEYVKGDVILSIECDKEKIDGFQKQLFRDKIIEKKRRQELEKQVIAELIEEGEIFPETNRRPPIPKDVADAVWNRDGGKCVYCGSTENLHFDHIIPFSKGGDTSVENLQLLCRKCNLEKSNKIG